MYFVRPFEIGCLALPIFLGLWFLLQDFGLGHANAELPWLAWLLGYPHFFLSYFFLYGHQRTSLLKIGRHFVVAFVLPILLLLWVARLIWLQKPLELEWTLQIFWFVLGWHYTSQTFGLIQLSLVRMKVGWTLNDGMLLRAQCFVLWLLGWALLNSSVSGLRTMYGVPMNALRAPLGVVVGLSVLTLLLTAASAYRFQTLRGTDRSIGFVWIVFISNLIWFLMPPFFGGMLAWLPFLHAAQYLPAALRYTWHQAESRPVIQTGMMYLIAVVLGGVFMYGVPNVLSTRYPSLSGIPIYLMASHMVINVHHFFIDAVIWRTENASVREVFLR